jgi:hypothetical protein
LDVIRGTVSEFLKDDRPATIAVIPQFNEAYIAYNEEVTVHKARPEAGDTLPATVEDRDWAIGSGAPWDKDVIAQLGGFPKAKFIDFWQNRLWVIDGDNYLRWSAASPYHRVWPSLAFAPLMESDNSPPTGMKSMHDMMLIYKNDSIWGASFAGLDSFEIPMYAIRKMAKGVGAVGNGTIVDLPFGHVFLSEDGVQIFDGVTTRKASNQRIRGVVIDRLKDIWPRITPGKRTHASAVHWRARNLYIISVPYRGSSVNNLTLVWNYEDDTWWIWDNIEAQYWLKDEDQYDNETLYFGNDSGKIFKFGEGDEDNYGAITAYVLTRRLQYKTLGTTVLNEVEITSQNSTDALDVRVSRNGTPIVNSPAAGTMDFSDAAETEYGDAMGSAMSWHMERVRTIPYWEIADHVQVEARTARKGRPFNVGLIRAGYRKLGR